MIRVVRQEAADNTALSQASAKLTAAPSAPVETAPQNDGAQSAALVAQTRADIIANASQALRAQATVDPQNVAELLSG